MVKLLEKKRQLEFPIMFYAIFYIALYINEEKVNENSK